MNVIIQVPPGISSEGIEILVRTDQTPPAVDIRPAFSAMSWIPLEHVGGKVAVR